MTIFVRCELVDVVVEIDRILRPGGYLVIHDSMEMLSKLSPILRSLQWSVTLHQKQFLVGKKSFWRPMSFWSRMQTGWWWCILNQNYKQNIWFIERNIYCQKIKKAMLIYSTGNVVWVWNVFLKNIFIVNIENLVSFSNHPRFM